MRVSNKELNELNAILGEEVYERIRIETWEQRAARTPPVDRDGNLVPFSMVGVWEEFLLALRAAVKH